MVDTADAARARAEALIAAATPGPWLWNPDGGYDERGKPRPRMFLEAHGRLYRHILKVTWPELLRDGDAEFIAAARELVPALLVDLDRLTAERDRARSLAQQNLAICDEHLDRAEAVEARNAALTRVVAYYAERRNHTTRDERGVAMLWWNDSFDGNGPGARARVALAAASTAEPPERKT